MRGSDRFGTFVFTIVIVGGTLVIMLGELPRFTCCLVGGIVLATALKIWHYRIFVRPKEEARRRAEDEARRARHEGILRNYKMEEVKRRSEIEINMARTSALAKAIAEDEERALKDAVGFKDWKNYLQGVKSGEDYERKIVKVFERLGYASELTPRSGDNGVDIIVHTPRGNFAVQCKFYNKRSVGNDAVQEVVSGMLFVDNCIGGIVVTNSTFTDAAKTLAVRHGGIKLLHHSEIPDCVAKLQANEARVQ